MLLAVPPLTFPGAAVGPLEDSLAVLEVVFILALARLTSFTYGELSHALYIFSYVPIYDLLRFYQKHDLHSKDLLPLRFSPEAAE
jgi:hypothetical protein